MLIRTYDSHMQQLSDWLIRIARSRAHRFLQDGWALLLFLGAIAVGCYPWSFVTGTSIIPWSAAVLSSSLLLTLFTYLLMHRSAARQLRHLAPQFARDLARGRVAVRQAVRASERESKAGHDELQRQCTELATTAARERQQRCKRAEADFQGQSAELEQAFSQQLAQSERDWEIETDRIRAHFRPLIDQRRAFYAKQREQALQLAATRRQGAEQQFEREGQELRQRWQEAIDAFVDFSADVDRQCAPVVADLPPAEQTIWQPPATPPLAVKLGHYELALPAQPGVGDQAIARIAIPALLSFPHDASLLLKTTGAGPEAAVHILQNATLRLLTAFPAGKLRMTIIDPLGLGQNFSAFMHLADYDERLVGNRIWTEAAHINQRLMDLTEHMENVIQKYLRNEFQSIQEYNERAGEVAEPFRILVVANYPHQFSDDAIRRLASIAASGPRCGVYTLMSVDMSAKLPQGAPWDELQRHAQVFYWTGDQFANEHEPLARLPLTFDLPPDSQRLTQIIKAVGQKAQDTRRVQVPFEVVTPTSRDVWTNHCDEQLTIPLGRSGATQTLSLKLGQGTSQHVLIAGKTGSGKSTLLHAMITSAALRYSPDEVQFYLIDFKKGVEFKAYADFQLPHARVIAIESEREFGLSVLRRLDHELRRRGDVFRESGVQSLAAYRARQPEYPLPRLLLIVDEFQEFFVNDDKLAHEASLLLDRLVRQGRAFGIHVILGSQTLAGAYSLARSTIGQMAVRIALECSASDAHLILSEDNTAARLLGRPGEAIYNDANGRLEGNHPFQIVWLPDQQRNDCLRQIRQRAMDDRRDDEPAIVFEGHAAADLTSNTDLQRLIEVGSGLTSAPPPRVWLGAAIEIKEPTSVIFRRQGGANLLIVGQSRESARGLLSSCLIGLTATHLRAADSQVARRASFWVLDGERAEQQQSDFADALQPYLNVALNVAGPAQAERTISRLAQELEQRIAAPHAACDSVYLVVHDLARFRDLQPAADDFGLGRFGDANSTTPAARLARILRDGPASGIHTLVWADGYHTISRWFDRQSLRDFGQRVLLQMSAVDSSHLMDSTVASQLGAYRAILFDPDRGEAEKFRPYAFPSAQWLANLRQQLDTPLLSSTNPQQGSTAADALAEWSREAT
jgi:hypothetical protein